MDTREERQKAAEMIRSFWLTHRGQSPQEQAYSVLADDHATEPAWMEAARHITQPTNESYSGGWVETTPLKPGQTLGLRGELLRSKTAPSVTELLSKRALQIATMRDPNNGAWNVQYLNDSTKLALMLSQWDWANSDPTLTAQFQNCTSYQKSLPSHYDEVSITELYSQITKARISLGDKKAIPDYGQALRDMQSGDLKFFSAAAVFEALWQNANDPEMVTTAESLFNSPTSFLYHVSDCRESDELIKSPLLSVPEFGKAIVRELSDTTCIQTVTVKAKNDVEYKTQDGIPYSLGNASDVPSGTVIAIRRCDIIAADLQDAEGTSEFSYYWPLERRNQAIQNDIDILQRYSQAYNYHPELISVWNDTFGPLSHMYFAPLATTATDEDVRSGRAIFTLGSGATKVAIDRLPLKAHLVDKTSKLARPNNYTKYGWIWQEEKDRMGNVYYGFVGPGVMAKESASDVEIQLAP
jgi:hypothetical protein